MNSPTPKISGAGYVYVILAAVLWAVSGSSAKFLFNHGLSSFQVLQLRITLATFVLFVFICIRQRSMLKINARDILYFVILGSGAVALVQFTYLFAISKIHVAAAILLQYLAPCIITVYTFIFTREKLEFQTITALILATSGCYLVVGAYNLNVLSMDKIGILSGLCSAAAFAWYTIQSEYGMRKYPACTVIFYAMLFAALPWNILYPPFEAFKKSYSIIEWSWILYIGVLGTALPFGLYLKGVHMIKPARASITATLEPITAGIISYLFLNEVMEPLQVSGGALVVMAIILLQIKRKSIQAQPDIIQTEVKVIT